MKKNFTQLLLLFAAIFMSSNIATAQDCNPGDIADDLLGITQEYCPGGELLLATNGEEVVDAEGVYVWVFQRLDGDSIPNSALAGLGTQYAGDLNAALEATDGFFPFPPGEYAAAGIAVDDLAAPSEDCLTPTENFIMFTIYEAGDAACDGGGGEECTEVPFNDTCDGAIGLDKPGGVGSMASTGPYDITCGTLDGTEPSFGWECFGEPDGGGDSPSLENSVWFSFEGDGNTYKIASTDCAGTLGIGDYITEGDTQFALYSGTCGDLSLVECNEDDPDVAEQGHYPAGLTVQTTVGVSYHLMVDAFNFEGTVSAGSFCVEMTMTESASGCAASYGTISAPASTEVCGVNDSEEIGVSGNATGDFTTTFVMTEGADLVLVGLAGGSGIINFDDLGLPYGDYTAHAFNYQSDQEEAILAAIEWGVTTGGDVAGLIADGTICAALDVDGIAFTYSECEFPIAIEDLDGIADLSVFPMPIANSATLRFDASEAMPVVINVFDLSGQLLDARNYNTEFGINNVSVDFSDFSAGIYFLSLETASGSVTQKVVKH